MKIHSPLLAAIFFCFLALRTAATTYYVDINSPNPAPPYSSWSTASTNLQNAINLTTNGDLVLIDPGIYRGGITATNAITLLSVNGSAVTWIDGNHTASCASLADGDVLTGFTLTNGYASSGGGVACATTNVFISNCLLVSNTGWNVYGGGAYSGSLSNCVLNDNLAQMGGAGAFSSVLNDCTISGNYNTEVSGGDGGGAFLCTLNHCVLLNNRAGWGGGADACNLDNCLVAGKTAVNNYGSYGEALGGGLCFCSATNCTIVNNVVDYNFYPNSSALGGGVYLGTSVNCIIYANRLDKVGFANFVDNYDDGGTFDNCCTTPLPAGGLNNFTNAPGFVNQSGGDYHLQSTSPCINAGNNMYTNTTADLDGSPRVVGGTVDIGAYEYQSPKSLISYAWLMQYGLPTDGSVDHVDLDGTAFNVYQDWIAGLNPTNPASVLAMLAPPATNNSSGIAVSWQSVGGINYDLLRSTNLTAPGSFITIAANLSGQAGTTSYVDTTATNNVPYFYRVGVP